MTTMEAVNAAYQTPVLLVAFVKSMIGKLIPSECLKDNESA